MGLTYFDNLIMIRNGPKKFMRMQMKTALLVSLQIFDKTKITFYTPILIAMKKDQRKIIARELLGFVCQLNCLVIEFHSVHNVVYNK